MSINTQNKVIASRPGYIPSTNKQSTSHSNEANIKGSTIAKFIAGGGALGSLIFFFKDGLQSGLNKIGSFATNISSIIALPVSILFPFILFKNEHKFLDGISNPGGSKDDSIFAKMVNTGVSLGYVGVTFSEPLISASKSKSHLLATMLNLPHILFSFMTYTGGRFFGLIKAIQRNNAKGNPREEYRLDQEFNALYTLGNLGSAQCSVIPMGNQCITGLEIIKDIFTGDLSSVMEKFKSGPMSSVLGTLFNSWMFPFEWTSKLLDTTIRTAEMTDLIQNLSKNPEKSLLIKGLKGLRDNWHKKINDRSSFLGKFLYFGREASKIEAVIVPPIGMMSVVLPTFNKFLRGEFFNKEIQEMGSVAGLFDKACGIGSFLLHGYYTTLYAATVRLPQFLTSAIFYGTSAYNYITGNKANPNKIRDSIFHKPGGIIDRFSDYIEKKLNKREKSLTGKNYFETINGKKICKQMPTYVKVMMEESWQPVREGIINKLSVEAGGKKPDKETLQRYLEENKDQIIQASKDRLDKYLTNVCLFDSKKLAYYKRKEKYAEICSSIEAAFESEYNSTLIETNTVSDKCTTINGVEIPKNLSGLLTKPKAFWEVLKMKYSFHTVNSLLPLNVREFVNVVDCGDPNDEWWYQNHLIQESAIRGGDLEIANRQELMPVFAHVVDRAREALPLLKNLFSGNVGRFLTSESAY